MNNLDHGDMKADQGDQVCGNVSIYPPDSNDQAEDSLKVVDSTV